MISVNNETLIPIRDLPSRLPRRPNGQRIHVATCFRWLLRGVGGVVLESARIGSTTYTSEQALQRFAENLAAATAQPPRKVDTPRTRRREIDRAAQRVADMLGDRSDDQ